MIHNNAQTLSDGDCEGIVGFIGKTVDDSASRLFVSGASLCPIFNEKQYLDE